MLTGILVRHPRAPRPSRQGSSGELVTHTDAKPVARDDIVRHCAPDVSIWICVRPPRGCPSVREQQTRRTPIDGVSTASRLSPMARRPPQTASPKFAGSAGSRSTRGACPVLREPDENRASLRLDRASAAEACLKSSCSFNEARGVHDEHDDRMRTMTEIRIRRWTSYLRVHRELAVGPRSGAYFRSS